MIILFHRKNTAANPLFILILCAIALLASGCGSSGDIPVNQPVEPDPITQPVIDPYSEADSSLFTVSEFDLDELLSHGLPVILNFGDDSQASQETQAALAVVHRDLGHLVHVCSVDLVQNPKAREDYPVQVFPTQFFFYEDGTPIPLPMSIGVIMSSFVSIDTEEPIFTTHEGAMSLDEFLIVLQFMNVITLEALPE